MTSHFRWKWIPMNCISMFIQIIQKDHAKLNGLNVSTYVLQLLESFIYNTSPRPQDRFSIISEVSSECQRFVVAGTHCIADGLQSATSKLRPSWTQKRLRSNSGDPQNKGKGEKHPWKTNPGSFWCWWKQPRNDPNFFSEVDEKYIH